jgi:hypothetical protein
MVDKEPPTCSGKVPQKTLKCQAQELSKRMSNKTSKKKRVNAPQPSLPSRKSSPVNSMEPGTSPVPAISCPPIVEVIDSAESKQSDLESDEVQLGKYWYI